MPEGMSTAGGTPIDIDPAEQDFARAMAAPEPGQKPDYPAPKRRDPDAPHGRDAKGEPNAPHGYKPDGKPRVTPPGPGRGHTGKAGRNEKARVQSEPKTGRVVENPSEVKARRADDATTSLELIGAGLSLFAMIGQSRAQGKASAAKAKGDDKAMQAALGANDRAVVLQLDAAACAINADAVGPSLAEMAEKNQWTAMIVDRLALFNGVASVGISVLPLVYQVVANHAPAEVRDNLPPQLLQLGVLPPGLLMEKLAAQNAVKIARAQSAILAEKQEAEAELAALREHADAA